MVDEAAQLQGNVSLRRVDGMDCQLRGRVIRHQHLQIAARDRRPEHEAWSLRHASAFQCRGQQHLHIVGGEAHRTIDEVVLPSESVSDQSPAETASVNASRGA